MKNPIRKIIIAVIGLIIIGGILYRTNFFKSEASEKANQEKTGNTPPPKPKSSVKAYIVKNEVLENKISAVGTITSNEEVALTCETAGKITNIYFSEGSQVAKGKLLVKLNDAELQSQLKKVYVQKELLEKRKVRSEKLHERQGISDEELEALTAELNTRMADIDVIKAQIERTKLHAPFSGSIGLRYVSDGSYVTASTPIASLIDLSSIKIDFTIPEKYTGQVNKGTKVLFTVAGRDKNYEATVYAVEPKIDVSTRTIKIRAISTNKNHELLPGAFANIKIILNKIDNALMIPAQALVPELEVKKVYRMNQGKAEAAIVETGVRTETKIQIIKGLNIGDTIISSGILQIKPGAAVKITEVE